MTRRDFVKPAFSLRKLRENTCTIASGDYSTPVSQRAKTEADFNNWIAEKKESWFKHFPSGTAYRVHCLDGGAWDRPTSWGAFGTLEEAKECCMTGPRWLNRPVVKNEAA